jgi:hypothetical protein
MREHSPVTDMVAAEKAEAALAQVRADIEQWRRVAQDCREWATAERYGWRAPEYGAGVEARIGTVIAWCEHIADQLEAEAIDYRRHALGLVS